MSDDEKAKSTWQRRDVTTFEFQMLEYMDVIVQSLNSIATDLGIVAKSVEYWFNKDIVNRKDELG